MVGEAVNLVLFIYGLAAVIGLVAALLIKGIVGALALAERRAAEPTPVAAPPPASLMPEGIPPHHLVVIAAAAHAMVGAHRVVHIAAVADGQGWAAEGRAAHHTSHRPADRH